MASGPATTSSRSPITSIATRATSSSTMNPPAPGCRWLIDDRGRAVAPSAAAAPRSFGPAAARLGDRAAGFRRDRRAAIGNVLVVRPDPSSSRGGGALGKGVALLRPLLERRVHGDRRRRVPCLVPSPSGQADRRMDASLHVRSVDPAAPAIVCSHGKDPGSPA